MILQLSNGSLSVDFVPPGPLGGNTWNNIYINRNGYKQLVGREIEPGVFERVTETIDLFWYDSTDSYRANTLSGIYRLAYQAAEATRQNRRYDLVWLEARGNTENQSRYAQVFSIRIEEMPPELYGPNRVIPLRLIIEREGVFGAAPPPIVTGTSVALDNIDNRSDAGYTNYYEILQTLYGGDANSLLKLYFTANHNVLIAKKSNASPATLNLFNPNLYVNGRKGHDGATITADAAVPGGEKAVFSASAAVRNVHWNLGREGATESLLPVYRGRHGMYALCRMTAGSGWIRYRNFPAPAELDWVRVASTTTSMVYLGQAMIPHQSFAPSSYFFNQPYITGIECRDVVGGSLEIFGVVYVPVEEHSPVLMSVADDDPFEAFKAVDGFVRQTYPYSFSDTPPISPSPTLIGDYPTLEVGLRNRFYFWWLGENYSIDFSQTFAVGAEVSPRYRSLSS